MAMVRKSAWSVSDAGSLRRFIRVGWTDTAAPPCDNSLP